jgi:hypothetical protein
MNEIRILSPQWRRSMEALSGKGGKRGIRTLGGHEAHNGFRDRPIQPLWHLPKHAAGIIT